RPPAQLGTAPEHECVVADEERAHDRPERVARVCAFDGDFDRAPQPPDIAIVVFTAHSDHASRAGSDLRVTGEFDRLRVTARDPWVPTTTKGHRVHCVRSGGRRHHGRTYRTCCEARSRTSV